MSRSPNAPVGRVRRRLQTVLSTTLVIVLGLGGALVAAEPSTAATDVDVTTNISGPSAGVPGGAFTYTVTVGNNSANAADGTTLKVTMPSAATNVSAQCTAAAGASCPTDLAVSNAAITGTVGTLPHLGLVTLTITGNFGMPSPSSVTASSHVDPPAGTVDTDPSTNDSSIGTAINNNTDVGVTLTQSSGTVSPGAPISYTLTYTNSGPAPADNATLRSYFTWTSGAVASLAVKVDSCVGAGGASCPSFVTDTTVPSSFTGFWTGSVGPFPAGASITIQYTVTPTFLCGSTALTNNSTITAPSGVTDANQANNATSVQATASGPVCMATSLSTTKTQSSATVTPGSPNTYTVTYRNDGPLDADGAKISDFMYWSGNATSGQVATSIVSCTGTGGASCPSFIKDGSIGSYGNVWSGNLGAFPVGATLVIVYTATPNFNACGTGTIGNQGDITPPPGMSNSAGSTPSASVSASLDAGACPTADLAVTRTQSSSKFDTFSTQTYTVTYTNNGAAAADGASIAEQFTWPANSMNTMQLTIQSCTGSGGVSCPSFIASTTVRNGFTLWNGSVGPFPAGATLTITYSIVPNVPTCPATFSLTGTSTVAAPAGTTDPVSSNNSAATGTTLTCADIAINKTVTPAAVQAGEPLSFSITVSNSSPNVVSSVAISDPLPVGFEYGSANCVAAKAGSVCGPVSYDPATRTVSTVVTTINGGNDAITITIDGTAGVVPGTYVNTATAAPSPGADAFYDPDLSSNASTVSMQVFNTLSTITVTKQLTGLPASGLPMPLTFSGTVECVGQPAQTWRATIPAGGSSATAAALTFWDGDACTIQEDAPPAAPPGLSYAAGPTITPDSIAKLGPNQRVAVTSTTPMDVAPAPVAADDTATTAQGTPVTIPALANDSGVNITITSVGASAHGTATINPDGTLEFAPTAGFSGDATFPYTITDALGRTSTATVTVTVVARPVAADDAAQAAKDTPVVVPVLSNDSGTGIAVTGVGTSPDGTADIQADGTVTFTPNPGFTGTTTFDYTITDALGQTSTATVTVTVLDDPAATDDTAITPIGTPVTIPVLSNDGGTGLTISQIGTSPDGTIVVNPDDTVTFTPNAGFTGTATFPYTVSDGLGRTSTATVTVIVVPTPTAADDAATTPQDTPVEIPVLVNDTGTSLEVTAVGTSPNGTATLNPDRTITFTPNPGFGGTATFTYTVTDAAGQTATATVTVTVVGKPTAADTTIRTGVDKPVTTDLSALITGTSVSITDVGSSPDGTAVLNPDGTLTFTPNAGFTGTTTVTYTVTDAVGQTATGTVTIVVVPGPTANPDSASTTGTAPVTIDVIGNDTGDGIRVTGVQPGAHGTPTLNPDGTITFTPEAGFVGEATFTYTITDAYGNTSTATVTVTVNAPAVPVPPGSVGGGAAGEPAGIAATGDGLAVTGSTFSVTAIVLAALGVLAGVAAVLRGRRQRRTR